MVRVALRRLRDRGQGDKALMQAGERRSPVRLSVRSRDFADAAGERGRRADGLAGEGLLHTREEVGAGRGKHGVGLPRLVESGLVWSRLLSAIRGRLIIAGSWWW